MNPYRTFPSRQFWSKGVSRAFDAAFVGDFPRPLIRGADRIASAGSCFAANLAPRLEQAGFQYVRTEYVHPVFAQIPVENLGYARYSAGYGNIYTSRQLRQLLARCQGRFAPVEDRWIEEGRVIDPFRPGLRYYARCEREFDLLTAAHLKAALKAFLECSVFIFTLGLTEAWVSAADGAVLPACPGTIAGAFDPKKHVFVNFRVDEVMEDLRAFIVELREINPAVRVILTVSPVPLVATAAGKHVLAATTYSKSVLRVAAEAVCEALEDVHYFPAYEIVAGPQAPFEFFEADRRHVSAMAIEAVMAAFLGACERLSGQTEDVRAAPARSASEALSARISDIDCEEAAQDK